MAELTVQQAHKYSEEKNRRLSTSYLTRAAREGIIKARKVTTDTGVSYYMLDQEALDAYLAQPRRYGPKPGSKYQPKAEASADA